MLAGSTDNIFEAVIQVIESHQILAALMAFSAASA